MIFFCVFKNIFPPLQPLWERVHIKAKKSENFLNKFANLKKENKGKQNVYLRLTLEIIKLEVTILWKT